MMYLEPAPGAWIRRDKLSEAIGAERHRGAPPDPTAPPSNGVNGDGRKSTPQIGEVGYDIHINEAVAQIKQLLGDK